MVSRRLVKSAAAAGLLGLALKRSRTVAPRVDPEAGEDLGSLHGRPLSVTTSDGATLSAELHGPDEAAATVVMAHGYVLSDRCWHYQVKELRRARPDLRVVTYDHRGHGRSGPAAREAATIQRLGTDLGELVDAVAPDGPVVLAGHSMGGMTIMALAEQRPELFGPVVKGVTFVSTSSGRLGTITYGMPGPLGPLVRAAVPWLNERAKAAEAAGKAPKSGGSARVLFGRDASPAQVRHTLDVMAGTPAATVANFHYSFLDHDRVAALSALRDVPVHVLVGERDALCPVSHGRAIADALPHSRFVELAGAGHMLLLERHREVSAALLEVVEQSLPVPAAVSR